MRNVQTIRCDLNDPVVCHHNASYAICDNNNFIYSKIYKIALLYLITSVTIYLQSQVPKYNLDT